MVNNNKINKDRINTANVENHQDSSDNYNSERRDVDDRTEQSTRDYTTLSHTKVDASNKNQYLSQSDDNVQGASYASPQRLTQHRNNNDNLGSKTRNYNYYNPTTNPNHDYKSNRIKSDSHQAYSKSSMKYSNDIQSSGMKSMEPITESTPDVGTTTFLSTIKKLVLIA